MNFFTFYDWANYFLPATLALLQGENPHAIIFNPSWAIFPLIPFAFYSAEFGAWFTFAATLVALAMVAHRLGARLPSILIILSVPYALGMLWSGNVEWLALLGLLMPQNIGLIFLAIKPQIGIGVMVFWTVETWRKSGKLATLKLIAPLITMLGLSFWFFGFWMTDKTMTYTQFVNAGNASFFPFSLPIGFALFATALRTHNLKFALASSPMFFPVLTPQCWLAPMLALSALPMELLIADAGIWIASVIPNGRG